MSTKNEKLVIEKVDKYEAKWVPSVIFKGFRIRAVLTEHRDAVTEIQQRHLLTRKLRREFGVEGEDWIIEDNFDDDSTDLYLHNTGKLLMWKLQDQEAFSKLFGKVEQHVDNIDEIREQQEE